MASKNNTVLAFGELMLRHSVNDINDISELDKADKSKFVDSYGGSEANVLAALQNLGVNTRFLTAVPFNKEGEGAVKFLEGYGIDTDSIVVKGNNVGTYYVVTNCTDRARATKYDRDTAAITEMKIEDIDLDKAFEGVELFHFSGVNLALKGHTRQTCIELLKEAKRRGIKVSFDFNYRENLWKKDDTELGRLQGKEEAKYVFNQIVPLCDIVFASKMDIEGWFDFTGSMEDFLKAVPSIDCIISRDKKQLTKNSKEVVAGIHTKNGSYLLTPARKFNVKENIGGGDAFDAGILYGLLNPEYTLEDATKFGVECYVMKHQIPGDVFIGVNKDKVEASIAENESGNQKGE